MTTSPSLQQQTFRLQPEVIFDGSRLVDSLTGHQHSVNPLALQVLWLDTEEGVDEAIAHVAREANVRRSEIEDELRQLLLLGLLEGSCTDAREQLRRLHRGEALSERVLPGSRLQCCGSGACCRGWVFGPVSDREKAAIESLPLRERLPYVGEGPWFQPIDDGERIQGYRLATRGEACVFLDAQSRCGLHAAFGADAKPAFCQLFPIASIATIDGLKVFDRGECASFAVSSRSGKLIEEHLPEVRHLLSQELYHPRVILDGGWRCDYSLVLRLARVIDADIGSLAPQHALRRLGQRIRDFTRALIECPLAHGQPEFAVSRALQLPLVEAGSALAPDAESVQRGLGAFADLAQMLASKAPAHASFARCLASAAACAARRASTPCETSCDGPWQMANAPRVPTSVDFILTLSMRQQIFGHELLLSGSLPAGLLRLICVTVLSRLLAQSYAERDGCAEVTDVGLGVAHMQIKRALSHLALRETLLAQSKCVWVILDALVSVRPEPAQ